LYSCVTRLWSTSRHPFFRWYAERTTAMAQSTWLASSTRSSPRPDGDPPGPPP
jgi:hypothetical protein